MDRLIRQKRNRKKGLMAIDTKTASNNDILLAQAMPKNESMYGRTPTSAAVILRYYGLYGYRDRHIPKERDRVLAKPG